jgi:hypothetical protein
MPTSNAAPAWKSDADGRLRSQTTGGIRCAGTSPATSACEPRRTGTAPLDSSPLSRAATCGPACAVPLRPPCFVPQHQGLAGQHCAPCPLPAPLKLECSALARALHPSRPSPLRFGHGRAEQGGSQGLRWSRFSPLPPAGGSGQVLKNQRAASGPVVGPVLPWPAHRAGWPCLIGRPGRGAWDLEGPQAAQERAFALIGAGSIFSRNAPEGLAALRPSVAFRFVPWHLEALRRAWRGEDALCTSIADGESACAGRTTGARTRGQVAQARPLAIPGHGPLCPHPGRPSSTALHPASRRFLPGGSGLSRPLHSSSPPPQTARARSGRAGAAPGPPVKIPPSRLELRAIPGLGGQGRENLIAPSHPEPACAGRSPGARAAVAPGSASASLPWALPGTHRRAPPAPVQHCAPCSLAGLACLVFGPVPSLAFGQAASANNALASCPGKGRASPSRSRCRHPGSNSAPSLAWLVGRPLRGLPLADSRAPRVVPPAARRSSLRAGPPPPLAKLRCAPLRRRTCPPLLTPGGRLCPVSGQHLRLGWPRGRNSPHGQGLKIQKGHPWPRCARPVLSLACRHAQHLGFMAEAGPRLLRILILPPAPRWGGWPGPKIRASVAESRPPPVPWGGVSPVGESCASYASASSAAAAPRARRPAGSISCSGLRLGLLRGRNSPPNRP